MQLQTEYLTLKTVTNDDICEVARTWNFEKGAISLDEAQEAIDYMKNNHSKNKHGCIHHFCFAVYEKGKPGIIGWCGLDGNVVPGQVVIFYMIASEHRNKGYATQCAARLLTFAFEEFGLICIHGGCDKENIASFKVMEKVGMIQNAFEDNGDPLFYINETIYFGNKALKS